MIDIIKKQKFLADRILNKLSDVDSNVILAGGAPRDWYFNKQATDLDFYIKPPTHLPPNMLQNFLAKLLDTEVELANTAYLNDIPPCENITDDEFFEFLNNSDEPNFSKISESKNPSPTYSNHPDIAAVYNAIIEGDKIQIIIMKQHVEPIHYIQHFSNSLCKIIYKNGEITPSIYFVNSISSKIMVVTLKATTALHINKMLLKFPDYGLYFE